MVFPDLPRNYDVRHDVEWFIERGDDPDWTYRHSLTVLAPSPSRGAITQEHLDAIMSVLTSPRACMPWIISTPSLELHDGLDDEVIAVTATLETWDEELSPEKMAILRHELALMWAAYDVCHPLLEGRTLDPVVAARALRLAVGSRRDSPSITGAVKLAHIDLDRLEGFEVRNSAFPDLILESVMSLLAWLARAYEPTVFQAVSSPNRWGWKWHIDLIGVSGESTWVSVTKDGQMDSNIEGLPANATDFDCRNASLVAQVILRAAANRGCPMSPEMIPNKVGGLRYSELDGPAKAYELLSEIVIGNFGLDFDLMHGPYVRSDIGSVIPNVLEVRIPLEDRDVSDEPLGRRGASVSWVIDLDELSVDHLEAVLVAADALKGAGWPDLDDASS